MSIELIRRFEPILYFHKDETLFPSDAKRYLEHCELWRAKKPFRDKTSWGKRLSAGNIAAAKDEVLQLGEIYLGIKEDATFPFLGTKAEEELFLNPSGWTNAGGGHETVVTSSTKNRFAALKRLADLYGSSTGSTPIVDLALRGSRFWYHAEVFSASHLRIIAKTPDLLSNQPSPIDLNKLLDRFTEPTAICYYLFFPGHIEGLQGCESVETGPDFASFVGEWACITILLDRDEPKFLGLASRNANKNGEAGALGRVRDKDDRVGMVIHNWDEVNVVATSPDHPKLFVAKGTHSLYLKPGQTVLQPMTPGDPARANCGSAEPLAATVIDIGKEAGRGGDVYLGIFAAKIAAGILVAGVLGAVVSLIWSILEDKPVLGQPFGSPAVTIPPPTPGEPQKDFPPEDGHFGKIVHPRDFVPPDGSPTNRVPWPAGETLPIGGRTYSIIVDRRNMNEALRQVWFPGSAGFKGYEGRWGPRVSPDDFDRRSGMRFPPFVNMFLHALSKHLSSPSP
jgi:hypothetical protein